jgi:hypothetical protein
MYQNRLRFSEYVSLFEQQGARIVRVEGRVDERSVKALREGLPLADKFVGLEPNELATTELSIMAQFRQRNIPASL